MFRKTSIPFIVFLLCLATFIFLKVPHIGLPFFWDEAGVYGRIVFQLADQGLSLHPKAINEWLSRGHPLLYPNMIAGVCIVFGKNVVVAHAANFAIACTLLISLFFCLRKIFNPWVGLIAAVFLMIQPIFYTQSVLVLPEVALTLSLWWATWGFINKNYHLYILFGTAAVLIKEPAIIWLASLFLWDLMHLKKTSTWRIVLWLAPIWIFGIFLVIQKAALGWYFFPYHAQAFDFSFLSVAENLKKYLLYLFWEKGRLIWLAVGLLSIGLGMLDKAGKFEPDLPFIKGRYLCALFAASIYVLFSSTTFFGQRYILPVFPVVCTLMAILVYYYTFYKQYILILIFLGITTFTSFYFFMVSNHFNYDNDMSYVRSVKSSKKTIEYLLDRKMLDDEFSATMPIIHALTDARLGYLPKGSSAKRSNIVHPGTKYVVKVSPGTDIENPKNLPLELIDEWYDHDIKTSIYKVIEVDSIIE